LILWSAGFGSRPGRADPLDVAIHVLRAAHEIFALILTGAPDNVILPGRTVVALKVELLRIATGIVPPAFGLIKTGGLAGVDGVQNKTGMLFDQMITRGVKPPDHASSIHSF
jgi:hypothetical protein